jgi:uncharacterized protein YgfB (UPF0149 family)
MTATGLVGHDDIDALIMRLRLGTEASELHGSLCGYLAGGGSLRGSSVLAALQLDGEATDPELGFEPLLPEDDRPLAERAEAMVDWCRGFLGGFGLAGAAAHAQLSAEAQEILRDLGTIAASSFNFGDEDEDEDALVDVHEFVRVAALLLHTECTAHDPSASGSVH